MTFVLNYNAQHPVMELGNAVIQYFVTNIKFMRKRRIYKTFISMLYDINELCTVTILACFHQARQDVGNIVRICSPIQQWHNVNILCQFSRAEQCPNCDILLARAWPHNSWISLDQVQWACHCLNIKELGFTVEWNYYFLTFDQCQQRIIWE